MLASIWRYVCEDWSPVPVLLLTPLVGLDSFWREADAVCWEYAFCCFLRSMAASISLWNFKLEDDVAGNDDGFSG